MKYSKLELQLYYLLLIKMNSSIALVYRYPTLYFLSGNDYFAVDLEGNITVNNDLSSKFSRLEIIDFKLIARDSGGLSATSTVSIIFPGVSLYLYS